MVGKPIIIEYPFEQRSPEWFRVRLGKLSGSIMDDLMPSDSSKVKWTRTQMSILFNLASQIMTGERKETFQSKSMNWGEEQESAAMAFYSQITGHTVRPCGFFESSFYPGCGVSPDGIISLNDRDIGTLEIKCPDSSTHTEYLYNPASLWNKYKWQVYHEVLITGAKWAELISFDPRFNDESKRMVLYRPELKEEEKLKLITRISEAREMIKKLVA